MGAIPLPTIVRRVRHGQFPRLRVRLTSPASILSVALLLLLLPVQAAAQALYGSIDGNVTDPSNAAIAGATVTARNTGTGESRQTTTNTAGGYSFPNLYTGAYDVTVLAPGFQPFTQTAVRVTVNSIVRVDTRLQVGVVAEAVAVEAGATRLQTEQSAVRYEVDR